MGQNGLNIIIGRRAETPVKHCLWCGCQTKHQVYSQGCIEPCCETCLRKNGATYTRPRVYRNDGTRLAEALPEEE